MIPGEIRLAAHGEPHEANVGLEVRKIVVSNRGDRPIQVGSHFHFFETNSALDFDRSRREAFDCAFRQERPCASSRGIPAKSNSWLSPEAGRSMALMGS